MTMVRRLAAVGAFLALAAVFSSSHLWGETAKPPAKPEEVRLSSLQGDLDDLLATKKFTQEGVLTYQTAEGDVLAALNVKPPLKSVPPRPRDYLVLVQTTAGQVGAPLALSRLITEELVKNLRAEDQVSIWTLNIPQATRDLTAGFKSAKANEVTQALAKLKEEVPLGAADLKGGLRKALRNFAKGDRHQKVILYLGDGTSTYDALTSDDRTKLCADMVDAGVVLFSIPLGNHYTPENVHGLATGTGGLAIRPLQSHNLAQLMKQIDDAVSAPVLYPKKFELPADQVIEYLPTSLPPLRSDAPTLVLARIKPGNTLTYKIQGTVAGQDVTVAKTETVYEPVHDNFFLVSMYEQWKHAKDQPALIRGDRALAFAYDSNIAAREELIAEGQWALSRDRYEAASTLFEQAERLNPGDVEAKAGLKIVEQLRTGKLTKDDLRKHLSKPDNVAVKITKADKPDTTARNNPKAKTERVRMDYLAQLAQDQKKDAAADEQGGEPEIQRQQRQRLAVEEQRMTQAVTEAERLARRLLTNDPDAAREELKRTLDSVRDHPDLAPPTRQALVNRLQTALRNVEVRGAVIKRQQEERIARQAHAQEEQLTSSLQTAQEERTRERMRVFNNLMSMARYEEAYKQALAIQQDALNTGSPIDPSTTAAYNNGLRTTNLQAVQDLRRIRDEKVLVTLLQVEKSAVPFPDEPPTQFPPAKVWRELTNLRKNRYESSGLGEETPKKTFELMNKLAMPIDLDKGIDKDTPLRDALEFLSDRYDLTILIDTQAFKDDLQVQEVEQAPVKLPKMKQVALGTVLRLLLAQANGTYIIRRDFIEVTTAQRQILEKTIRVYPVADLVIPIPNSLNQQAVNQTINNSILGAGGIGGLGSLGIGALGAGALGLGALGAGALGLGALGLGGLGAGALGVGGLGAGGLGAGGGGVLGANALGFGGGGQQNLGNGGGLLGIGGSNLGQIGNLGGQFGFQGGDQSAILIRLIRETVGTPRDWAPPGALAGLQQAGGQNANAGGDEPVQGDPNEAGNLGYYPPARALVVKATSRIHTRLGGGLLGPRPGAPAAPGGMGMADRVKDGDIVIKPKSQREKDEAVAKTKPKGKDTKDNKDNKDAVAKKAPPDPKTVWQEAVAKGVREGLRYANDPGLVIAVADYLFEHKKYDHAAEFLKANLREGVVARPWVYDSLAVALESSGGSVEEIERARLSAVDLQPQDAEGYRKASQAMAAQKRYDRALAYSRQAAQLQPNVPETYADALVYAESGKDVQAMEWAAGNLLRRDWPRDNDDIQAKARAKLDALAQVLKNERRASDAQRMVADVERVRERDFVVRLKWQGDADLDLKVREPIGTTCSYRSRFTPGGGALIGETFSVTGGETYVAAEAFPGKYEITVDRVWGRPLGNKATLEVTRHQGTPQETVTLYTLTFDKDSPSVVVNLESGRRTAVAVVPTPVRHLPRDIDRNADRVLNKLRALADPIIVRSESGLRGGTASNGQAVEKYLTTVDASRVNAGGVQKVDTAVMPNIDLAASATLSRDRRTLTLTLQPVFETAGKGQAKPTVINPLIPGGSNDGSR